MRYTAIAFAGHPVDVGVNVGRVRIGRRMANNVKTSVR